LAQPFAKADRRNKLSNIKLSKMLLIILTMAMFNLNNTKVFPHVCTEKKNRSKNRSFFRELNAEQRLWDVLVDPARKSELETNCIWMMIH
jgi:hypothetical protein